MRRTIPAEIMTPEGWERVPKGEPIMDGDMVLLPEGFRTLVWEEAEIFDVRAGNRAEYPPDKLVIRKIKL